MCVWGGGGLGSGGGGGGGHYMCNVQISSFHVETFIIDIFTSKMKPESSEVIFTIFFKEKDVIGFTLSYTKN